MSRLTVFSNGLLINWFNQIKNGTTGLVFPCAYPIGHICFAQSFEYANQFTCCPINRTKTGFDTYGGPSNVAYISILAIGY